VILGQDVGYESPYPLSFSDALISRGTDLVIRGSRWHTMVPVNFVGYQ
jgi:hypothetical protein